MGPNTGPICFPAEWDRKALELTQACEPIGARAARGMGFLDDAFGDDVETFETELRSRATQLTQDPGYRSMLRKKHESRLEDELVKPLASYPAEELEKMRVDFFGSDPAYHEARRRLVFKGNPPPRVTRPSTSKTWNDTDAGLSTGAAWATTWGVRRAGPRRGAAEPLPVRQDRT